jgi:tRNA (cmo5U34)-methyltransferase
MKERNVKSTPQEIQQRFDGEVDRFSNLQTGQSATIDAPLVLDLIAGAAAAINPNARDLLDVGCGAGNYTLKILQELPDLAVTIVDLSRPMLDRAVHSIEAVTHGRITAMQGDIRNISLTESSYDIIVAATVLHHLRTDAEWESVFRKFHSCLRPGGSVWISDLVEHDLSPVQTMMWERYGQYLSQLKDEAYRDAVFEYVAREDSPRSLLFQVDLLRAVGFRRVDVLHKNSVFAAFGAVKD